MRRLSIFRLLALALLIGGCNRAKDDIVPPAPDGPGGPTPPPFQLALTGPQGVRFTLVNDLVTIVEFGEVAAYFGVDGQENPPPATSTRHYLAGLYDGPLDEPIFTMTIGTLSYDEVVVDPDAFHDLFLPGPRTFGNPAMGGQGVALAYTDANGQRWATTCGNASQSGAQFQLLERATDIDLLGPKARIVATFQCTFHNCTTGEARPVLNGGLVLEFRDF